MDKTLYIIRHCSASGQDIEASLTEEGQQQALQLAEFLSEYPIKRIISSPYKRAVESIKPYALKRGLEIKEDERLGERILGSGNVPNWLELLEESFSNLSFALDGGESSFDAMRRINSLIDEIKDIPEEHILLVSHGNLTTLLLKIFDNTYGFSEWKAMTNPDVYMIAFKDEGDKIKRIWR